MKPRAFSSADAFRAWLERHHASQRELIVRCFKVHAARRGLTYREALDQALCFGWIDGVRRAFDEDSFSVRFTPRQAKSYWSAVNRQRASQLRAEGRVHAAGLAVLPATASAKARRYSFEARPARLSPSFEQRLHLSPQALAYFEAQPPWYRRTSAFWVMSARKEETREKRFRTLLDCCQRRRTIPPLTRPQGSAGAGR